MTANDGKPGTFRGVLRNWTSNTDDTTKRCYLSMEGRITLQTLVDHLTEICHESVDIGNVELNWATAVWEEPSTEEERELRKKQRDSSDARHEKWERETYAKLKAKFEGGE